MVRSFMDANAKDKSNISLGLSIFPFAITIASLLLSLFVMHFPLYVALLLGWMSAFIIALRSGYSWEELLKATWRGMKSTSIVVTILLLIGGVIAVWMASGTIAGFIVYSSQYVSGKYLVIGAFLITTAMSMLLGTSIGTLSTIGFVFAGMGQMFGIPAALIGGALMSGAMVGDRSSPLSGTVHLLAATVGVKAESAIAVIIRSGIPVVVLCTILYAILGYQLPWHNQALYGNLTIIHRIQSDFVLNSWVLLPPIVVVALAVARIPIRRNLFIGLLLGMGFAYFVQNDSFLRILYFFWNGYVLEDAHSGVHLAGGGVWNMFTEVLIIITAGALNGILEASGMMTRCIEGFLMNVRTKGGLLLATVILSGISGLVFCNQTLMVIIPGRMLQSKFQELQIDKIELVRTLANSGVVMAPLIPWNLHGILSTAAMGIPTMVYDRYAFFLWFLPAFTLIRGFFLTYKYKADRSAA
ncbi:hypothetical protein LSG31_07755 [Fodinisporobacter ferrooxydans]|uniref:Na+/H+ antiporter NhaC-like C-terminal domain-containing protein n=1 Tax=Fodinisporobacter ferrooxydans TaxID=2901836 RepID=A0ABY4CS89_9BACL|nr:hypothetical protein LSG31_07755 [Alicyclobacillaceae bacterium MYW30-H2]